MLNFKIIVNPAASRGKCLQRAKEVHAFCDAHRLDYDLVYTKKQGDAELLAYDAKDTYTCVVAVGGDGTINEIVNGLIGGRAKLGVIPVGSGNDFIRALDIPSKIDEALQTLIGMKTQAIDIGKAGNRYFQNGLGIGFDAWVVDRLLEIRKLSGTAMYLYAVLKTIYSYQPPTVHLSYNDINRTEKFYLITVGNGTSLGGGFKLTPDAIIDDGLFDLNIIRNLNKLEVYQNLIGVFSGKHVRLPQVTMDRSNHIRFESEEGFAAHVDGELLSLNLNSLDVTLLPKALEVVVS
jgi:YegS/Rv2252/BmrU family lipid kinase